MLAGGRITDAEGLALYRSNNLNALGAIANVVRERKNGNVATYIHNQYINYSNICVLSCQFCAFGARKRDPHAFELAADEVVERVRVALSHGITEIHMVGGLHPTNATAVFKKVLGMSIAQYLRRQRLSQAMMMLVDTDKAIIEIAFACGYGSLSRFYDAFQRHMGKTPRDYRMQFRK